MSVNYLMDTLGGSVECEINNAGVVNSTPILGKKFKGNLSQSDLGSQLKQQIKYTTENFTSYNSLETNLDKLRFSEKLKVLLKNGKSKNNREMDEPNAFKESDPQQNGSVTKSLNNFDSYFGKSLQSNVNTNNGSTQKSIVLSRSVRPDLLDNEFTGKDCNGEVTNNFNKNLKLSHLAVPIYATNNSGVTNLNQTGYSVQHVNQSDKFKLSNFKNGKTPVHVTPNNKTGLNKLVGKAKLQNLKHTNLNNSLKGSRNIFGKPFGFGSSQLHKQGNAKVEKKHLDPKQRNFQKRKPLLNQFQKTALLNRAMGQGPKKNPPKAPFFGMARPSQKDSDVPNNSNSLNKNSNKISLLEESLLGLKNQGSDISNGNLKSRGDGNDSRKIDYLQSILETGSTVVAIPPGSSAVSLDQSKHDSLERIWDIRNKLKGLKRDHHHFGLALNDGDLDESPNSECLLFQNYWFSVCNDSDTISNNNRRDTKLSQLKVELRHKIKQLQWTYKDEYRDKVVELLVDSARKQPNLTAFLIRLENSKFKNRRKTPRVKPFNLLKPTLCSYANLDSGQKCREQAMPCVKFCQQHITCSNDQLLFTTCSARKSDNTTCTAAVLNQNPANPLCLQHKRLENMAEIPKKVVNSKLLSRPSQPRKRSKSSTGSSSRSGKSRKRKRSTQKDKKELSNGALSCSTTNDSSSNFSFVKQGYINDSFKRQNALTRIMPQIISKCDIDESQEVEVGEEVLAMAADLPLELATQATKLLEEHDFTNVLNHIPADAFNDLFTEDKEEYEPTPQETEELERALEAVDKDVKSLEKLSQTQGILDTLLDEQTIAQTLAQLPEVAANLEVPQNLVPVFYQNGFSNVNQLEQTMHDVNKSLTQTVLLNQGTDGLSNHFVSNLAIPNHADLLQS